MSRPAVLVEKDWLEHAVRKIEEIARRQPTVTSEDLRRDFDAPEHQNQIGMAFRVAYHRKIITPVGYRQSKDRSRRGGAVRIWTLWPEQEKDAA